jgi:Caspase domain
MNPATKWAELLRLMFLIAAASVQGVGAMAQDVPAFQEPTADLRPTCTAPQYSPVPQPDIIANLLAARKRYRLVIGAGEFLDQPDVNNRTFVEPTATLVDSRLAELGYEALPGVSQAGKPYLVGKSATRAAITAALNEMATATQGQDFGIIYYVGHGNITPAGDDLSLAVYDEPVTADHGYRVSDIFGILETSIYRTSVTEIPHLFIILDACFSGTIAQHSHPTLVTTGGVQRLVEISGGGPVIPEQISLLTSTAAGASSSAYELHGTGLSAFGYYFARALKEDWACSDSLAKDGILTLQEMKLYLDARLQLASEKNAVDAKMFPSMLARDEDALLAYRPDKYEEPGFRNLISSLLIKPGTNEIAEVVLPGGAQTTCSNATTGCRVPVSTANAASNATIAVVNRAYAGQLPGGATAIGPSRETVKLADLVKTASTILGTYLQLSPSTAAH